MSEDFRVANPTRRRPGPRRPRQPVTVLLVDSRVMRVARRLAHGDMRRVELVDPTCVIVWNNPAADSPRPAAGTTRD